MVLRGGTLVSVVLIFLGLVAKVVSSSSFPTVPTSLLALPPELSRLSPAGLLSLGILALILTPIARVFLSILVFLGERDWVYVLITAVVFANLMVGVVIAL